MTLEVNVHETGVGTVQKYVHTSFNRQKVGRGHIGPIVRIVHRCKHMEGLRQLVASSPSSGACPVMPQLPQQGTCLLKGKLLNQLS
ncbi:hypothetical protein SK128_028403 [Halocaridina rubra]|uniref:Uncharacterized protein n=1 Tax=Halocaridina rubra TaxID=373956 RepID=A0AAN8XLF2_HALRR